eukprot:4745402-Alexandrium_andersonii.AAC.1
MSGPWPGRRETSQRQATETRARERRCLCCGGPQQRRTSRLRSPGEAGGIATCASGQAPASRAKRATAAAAR